MFNNQLSVPDWLSLSPEIRLKLASAFNLHRSSGSVVEGNVLKSDGYNHQDLAGITAPKMQRYLDTFEVNDFGILFQMVLDKIAGEQKVPEVAEIDGLKDRWKGLLLDMKLQAEQNNELELLELVIRNVFNLIDPSRFALKENNYVQPEKKGTKGRGRPPKRDSRK